MKSNQVNTIPGILTIEARILQIKTEILKKWTNEILNVKHEKWNHKDEYPNNKHKNWHHKNKKKQLT